MWGGRGSRRTGSGGRGMLPSVGWLTEGMVDRQFRQNEGWCRPYFCRSVADGAEVVVENFVAGALADLPLLADVGSFLSQPFVCFRNSSAEVVEGICRVRVPEVTR